jgi:hypothetical protein
MITKTTNSKIKKIKLSTEQGVEFSVREKIQDCFSEETLKSISKLGEVLRRIDRRMKNDGFCIRYGNITKR